MNFAIHPRRGRAVTLLMFAILAIAIALALMSIRPASATIVQPSEDSVDIDLTGCAGGTVELIDGTQLTTKITLSINGVVTNTVNFDDTIGQDDSGTVITFTAKPGDELIAKVYNGSEVLSQDTATVPVCPTATATATATATSTATATPTHTATPASTSTPAPTATPIVVTNTIIREVPVITERILQAPAATPATITVIRPPSTGDGGLLSP